MKNYIKCIPYILAIALFFVGRFTSPKPDTDLLKKYEAEREILKQQVKAKESQIIDLAREGKLIERKWYEDSLRFSDRLRSKDRAFIKLKKEYEKINLSRASVAELDSARAGIISLYKSQ